MVGVLDRRKHWGTAAVFGLFGREPTHCEIRFFVVGAAVSGSDSMPVVARSGVEVVESLWWEQVFVVVRTSSSGPWDGSFPLSFPFAFSPSSDVDGFLHLFFGYGGIVPLLTLGFVVTRAGLVRN